MQPESVNQPGTASVPPSAPRRSSSEDMRRLPVQDFLQLANWQGAPLTPAQTTTSTVATPVSSAVAAETTNMAVATAINAAELAVATDTPTSTATANHVNWQCLTVEQFFARQNWQGLAQPAMPVTTAVTVVPEPVGLPTLTATVQEFFQLLPWEATPVIGALPKTEAVAAPAEPEMTLSDLSDLF